MARISRKAQNNQPIETISTAVVYNTAIYARLSVMDRGRTEGESIANQQELLNSYIEEHPELTLKGVFIDNGETGVNFDRPAWIDLIRECRQGNINCIVIKDLSRLGRNYIETGDYLERILPMLGVRLIAVNDGYDGINLTNNERLVSNLKNLVNDIYAKDISRKVIAAMHTKQKNGEFLGKYAAYGYLIDPENSKKIVVNPETAPIVRWIYEMKAEGIGNGAICKKLNDEGVPCPNRYRYLKGLTQNNKYENCIWIISTVAEILRNTLYLGHMTQGKFHVALCEGKEKKKSKRDEWIIVPNTHEAIVSQELFDSANTVFDERAAEYKKHRYKYEQDKSNRSELLLYGVAFCADCGKALARRKLTNGRNADPHWAFGCKRHLDLHACTRKYVAENELYEAVYYAIRSQIQQYVDVTGILEKLNRDNSYKSRLMRFDSEIEELEKELRRLTSLRQAIYEDYVAKLLSASEYQYANEKYNKDIATQQSRLEAVKQDRTAYSKNTEQANKWVTVFSKFMDEPTLTLEMVHTMIERVEVSDLNRVSVIFKFCDEFETLAVAVVDSTNDKEAAS